MNWCVWLVVAGLHLAAAEQGGAASTAPSSSELPPTDPPSAAAPPTNAPPIDAPPEGVPRTEPSQHDAVSRHDENQMVVRARRRRAATETSISAREARVVAGTQGDPVKAVQNLPGIARASFGRGELVVWGAAPRDTRILIDGVEVPALYHLSGLRSVVHPDLVESIELMPGAWGVEFGRGIGGLVNVGTASLPSARVSGSVGVDLLDADASVATRPTERVRAAVTARRSVLGPLAELVADQALLSAAQDLVPIPEYLDSQAKVTFTLRQREELSVGLLAARDDIVRDLPAPDPTEARAETTSTSFLRVYGQYTRRGGGESIHATAWAGLDANTRTIALGTLETASTERTPLVGARVFTRQRALPALALQFGVDALVSQSAFERRGTLGLPAREGDRVVFGQAPSDGVNADRWSSALVDIAPFIAGDILLGGLVITPGVRVDGYALGASRLTPRVGTTPSIGTTRFAFVVDPRVAASWRTSSWLTLRAAGGTYHQPPSAAETSAVFGSPELGLEKATHVCTTAAAQLGLQTDLETTWFYRSAEDLVVRNSSPSPPLAKALVQDGVGWSTGATVLVRQRVGEDGFAWLAYTLSRSERQDNITARYRLSDFDQTHVVTALASGRVGNFNLSGRIRASTGTPRTPVAGAVYDARLDRFQPIFGSVNSERLPGFFQADARVDTMLRLGSLSSTLYADFQNITGQENAEEVVYSSDYSERGFIHGLPFLVVLGARVNL